MAEAARRLGVDITNEATGIEAVGKKGVVGAVLFDHWTRNSVRMHVLLESLAGARALLSAAFQYPFAQVGVQLLIAEVPSDNTKALRFNAHLGFRETYRLKDAVREGVDLVLMEMRREECRFLDGIRRAA